VAKSQVAAPIGFPRELRRRPRRPEHETDVLVLDAADVRRRRRTDRLRTLVCPLELRAPVGGGARQLPHDATPCLAVHGAVGGRGVRGEDPGQGEGPLGGLVNPVVHVLSTTWTVRCRGRALIDPDQRRVELGPAVMTPYVSCRGGVAMSDARSRVRARELVDNTSATPAGTDPRLTT